MVHQHPNRGLCRFGLPDGSGLLTRPLLRSPLAPRLPLRTVASAPWIIHARLPACNAVRPAVYRERITGHHQALHQQPVGETGKQAGDGRGQAKQPLDEEDRPGYRGRPTAYCTAGDAAKEVRCPSWDIKLRLGSAIATVHCAGGPSCPPADLASGVRVYLRRQEAADQCTTRFHVKQPSPARASPIPSAYTEIQCGCCAWTGDQTA